jgi:hypothetical protein
MLLEIRIKLSARKVNPAKEIVLQCDLCSKIYTTQWSTSLEKKFKQPGKNHFCNINCANDSQRTGILKNKKTEYFQRVYQANSPLGNQQVIEKAKKTNLERYGDEIPARTKLIKEKASKSLKIAYHNPETIEKKKETCLTRFGSETYMGSEQAKAAREKALLENYGVTIPFHSEEIKIQLKKLAKKDIT